MSSISGFSEFYSKLTDNLNKPQFDQNTTFDLVVKNMQEIAALGEKSIGFAFKNDGSLLIDTWQGSKGARQFIKQNIVQYSSVSEDIRNLKVFTAFVQNFVESRNLDPQKLFV
jgi:hypothetical protein